MNGARSLDERTADGRETRAPELSQARDLAAVGAVRTRSLITAVRRLDDAALTEPSDLPEWSRFTIVCHLRYGAHALLRMTRDAIAARETSYYPEGRERQRPLTLAPRPGETPLDVVDDWEEAANRLDCEWAALGDAKWAIEVVEPSTNTDLGIVPLARLALARLTEVDVHGTDLAIGFDDWSETLVRVGLPTRLAWLASRRTNHRTADHSVQGSWLLTTTDGLRWLVAVVGDQVESHPAAPTESAQATIEATARDALALLLGRPPRAPVRFGGDVELARSFQKAFPGP